MSNKFKFCWNCEFYHPLGLTDDTNGNCRCEPPKDEQFPRVSFNGDCSYWKINPEKVKIPGKDLLQKRINSTIKELREFEKELIKYTGIDFTYKDIIKRIKKIENILSGVENPQE